MSYLQFCENLREKSRLAVDSQHFRAQAIDDEETPVPELVLAVLDEERFEGVAYLVAHVTVAQIETSQHRGLEFSFGRLFPVNQFSYQHVNEHDVCRIYEGNILQHGQANELFKELSMLMTSGIGFSPSDEFVIG